MDPHVIMIILMELPISLVQLLPNLHVSIIANFNINVITKIKITILPILPDDIAHVNYCLSLCRQGYSPISKDANNFTRLTCCILQLFYEGILIAKFTMGFR